MNSHHIGEVESLGRQESESVSNLRVFDAMPNGQDAKKVLDRLPAVDRKRLEEGMGRLDATLLAQMDNGAGLPADKLLRTFLAEYNNRLRHYGARSMPTSFNVAEPFFVFPKGVPAFLLREEHDVSFSFVDFLDFVTSDDAPLLEMRNGYSLKESVIYNFNSSDEVDSLMLATESGCAYGFSAACMIRVGDELSIMLECGERATPEVTAMVEADTDLSTQVVTAGGSKHCLDFSKATREIVRIGSEGLYRNVLFIRFNLKEGRIDGWISSRDLGDLYESVTNLRETLTKLSQEAEDKMVEAADSYMQDRPALIELAKTLTLLPAYLSAKAGSITLKNVQTRLGLSQSSLKAKRAVAKASFKSRVMFRKITSIEIKRLNLGSPVGGRTFIAPNYQVPVSGFWRLFGDASRVGHDESGNEILGRTWVRAHVRYKDKPVVQVQPKIVYVKESLAKAKLLLAKYQGVAIGVGPKDTTQQASMNTQNGVDTAITETDPIGANGAFVYVMRCPAHGADIYKIGFTTRDPEQRAAELSRNTSTPAVFLVVQAWAVTKGMEAEYAVHQALAAMRVAGNREFFLGKYQRIREVTEKAITPWLVT